MRCAIYTRKSADAGLMSQLAGDPFDSLDEAGRTCFIKRTVSHIEIEPLIARVMLVAGSTFEVRHNASISVE